MTNDTNKRNRVAPVMPCGTYFGSNDSTQECKRLVKKDRVAPVFAPVPTYSCVDCLKDLNGPAVMAQMMNVIMISAVNLSKFGFLRKSNARTTVILVTKKASANKNQAVFFDTLLKSCFRRCIVSHFTLVRGCSILFKNRRTRIISRACRTEGTKSTEM